MVSGGNYQLYMHAEEQSVDRSRPTSSITAQLTKV